MDSKLRALLLSVACAAVQLVVWPVGAAGGYFAVRTFITPTRGDYSFGTNPEFTLVAHPVAVLTGALLGGVVVMALGRAMRRPWDRLLLAAPIVCVLPCVALSLLAHGSSASMGAWFLFMGLACLFQGRRLAQPERIHRPAPSEEGVG